MNEHKTFREIVAGDRLFLVNRILYTSEIYEVKKVICKKSGIIFDAVPIIAQKNTPFWISWNDVDDYEHYYYYRNVCDTTILTSDENHFLKLLEEFEDGYNTRSPRSQ